MTFQTDERDIVIPPVAARPGPPLHRMPPDHFPLWGVAGLNRTGVERGAEEDQS